MKIWFGILYKYRRRHFKCEEVSCNVTWTYCSSSMLDPIVKWLIDARLQINCCLFQDIVYALAHATGRTGRFTLIERWRNNERLLAPQENPLQVDTFIYFHLFNVNSSLHSVIYLFVNYSFYNIFIFILITIQYSSCYIKY